MNIITRAIIAFAFLIALASHAWADPNAAIRIKPSKNCFVVLVKNVRGAGMGFLAAELVVFDGRTCTKICTKGTRLEQKIAGCQSFEFRICCDHPLPPSYIAYVRVKHNLGTSEAWLFSP